MSGESAAAMVERERLRVDLDQTVRTAARRVRWLRWAVTGTYVAALSGAVVYVFFGFGIGWAALVYIIGYLVGSAPVFRVQETERLMTDASPAAVREQMLGLDNPFLSSWLCHADALFAPSASDDDDVVAIVERTFWLVYTRKIPIRLFETEEEDRVVLTFGDPSAGVRTQITTKDEFGTTIVEEKTRLGTVRPRQLVYFWLIEPYARQILAHHGYKVIESTKNVELRR